MVNEGFLPEKKTFKSHNCLNTKRFSYFSSTIVKTTNVNFRFNRKSRVNNMPFPKNNSNRILLKNQIIVQERIPSCL